MREKDSSFEKMFDSRLFINTARAMMICASVIGLPVAGFGLHRLIDKADTIVSAVDKTSRQVDLLDQSVRLTFEERRRELDRLTEAVKDHEGRMRAVERASNR